MEECIFCKIINKELPAEIFYEDDHTVVFKDIHPKAPIHFLIVPRKHITSVATLQPEDRELAGELLFCAQKVGEMLNLKGYKLQINVGKPAGQLVDHLHMHFLSGKVIELP